VVGEWAGLVQLDGIHTYSHSRPALSRLFVPFPSASRSAGDVLPPLPFSVLRLDHYHDDEPVESPLSSVPSYLSARSGRQV
jgi:hypothetical protein